MNEQIGNKINDKTYIKLTPFKGFVLENFPFIEADFDAITNYQLLCKVIEYLNNVISNQNTVQELGTDLVNSYNALVDAVNLAINEFKSDVTADINQFKVDINNDFDEFTSNITTQFNNLQNYVNNYFDNNFPELVSDKLDEMAEDGTLENLLNDTAHLIKVYNTYSEMISDSENFTDGLKLQTLGYYEVGDGGNAIYKVVTENSELVIKLVSDVNNILCHGVSLTDANNNNHTIINNVLSTYGFAYCNKNIIINNTLHITTDNSKFEFKKITYSGTDEAIILDGQSLILNGDTIIANNGHGLRIGHTNMTHNCNITLNRISAGKNAIIMGGTAGVLNSYMNISRLEYVTHGIYFDLSSSYVGQVALYNSIFADNSNETENYAIYMDCSENGMTGLDMYNISFEGAKGGIYASTTGTTQSKFLEHLNIFGCRLAEFSYLNNKKLLKLICPSSGINVEGEIHFDQARISAFDLTEYLSWNQKSFKLYGRILDSDLASHQLGSSPWLAIESRLGGGKLLIDKTYLGYVNQNTGSISDYIIPTASNIALAGSTNPNIKFTTDHYTLTGIYTININSNDITSVTFISKNGTTLRTLSNLESGDTIIVNSQDEQLNIHSIRGTYMVNTN